MNVADQSIEALIEYLTSLDKEDARAAVRALPAETRTALFSHVCHQVGILSRAIIDNHEHLWLTGELPKTS